MRKFFEKAKWHIIIVACTGIASWIINSIKGDNNTLEYIFYILGVANVFLLLLILSDCLLTPIDSCSFWLSRKGEKPEDEFNFEEEFLEYNGAVHLWRKGIFDNNHKGWLDKKSGYYTDVENIEEFKFFLEAIRNYLKHGITIIKIIIFPLALTLFTIAYQAVERLKDDVTEFTLKAVENLRDSNLGIEIPNDFYSDLLKDKGHYGLFWFLLFLGIFVFISVYLINIYLFLAKREEFVDKTVEILSKTNTVKSNIDSEKEDSVFDKRLMDSEGKKANKDKKTTISPKMACTIIIIICFLDFLIMCGMVFVAWRDKWSPETVSNALAGNFAVGGIAIVGIAVAVWAALNISNAIDRRELDSIRLNTNEKLKKEAEEIDNQKKEVKDIKKTIVGQEEKYKGIIDEALISKDALLRIVRNDFDLMLLESKQDIASKKILTIMEEYQTDASIFVLAQIEKYFSLVYNLHTSNYREDLKLIDFAESGIVISRKELERQTNSIVIDFIKYRLACFYFYKGYCVRGDDRKNCFIEAINYFIQSKSLFDAYIPEYHDYNRDDELGLAYCKDSQKKMSAYICNSIGESYSKIVEDMKRIYNNISNEDIQETITLYGKKAIFYCTYAVSWDNSRETYMRNLGCAIERTRGAITEYDVLMNKYKNAILIQPTESGFKVLLSLFDKKINHDLEVGWADPEKGRKKPLGEVIDIITQKTKTTKYEDTKKIMEQMLDYAEKTKSIFPGSVVGYIYTMLYYRDKCILDFKNNKVYEWLLLAQKALEMADIIAPSLETDSNRVLVKIFKKDIEELKCLKKKQK